MLDQNIINNWQVEHFIAYLYLAIADADNETTDDEVAMATRKTKRLFKDYHSESTIDHEALIGEVMQEIKNHKEVERTDLINEWNKKFHLTEDEKTDIISDLTDIIASDDHVQASEHYMLSFIRLVLAKNA